MLNLELAACTCYALILTSGQANPLIMYKLTSNARSTASFILSLECFYHCY